MAATTAKRDWSKVWVISGHGRSAWKWTDPSHTVLFDKISADVWADRMESRGFTVQDDRGKPSGNVWD